VQHATVRHVPLATLGDSLALVPRIDVGVR
jgi:hypothetical protein